MPKKTIDIPILVYGATMTGIGIAIKNPEQVLLVDKRALVGHEFIDAYNLGSSKIVDVKTSFGKTLLHELLDRKILTKEGNIHLPAMPPIICKMILDSKINALMMTTITNIEKTDNGFIVSIYNNSGQKSLSVGRIIDTTSEGLLIKDKGDRIIGKSLNAALNNPNKQEEFPFDDEEIKNNPNITCQKGKLDAEIYIKLKLEISEDWAGARDKLHAFWQNRPKCLKNWQLATISSTFDYWVLYSEPGDAGKVQWLPSCAYSNPLEAFEEGVCFIKGGAEQ